MFAHFAAIWTFRHFWMALVRMDLRTRYRRSVLGIGWSLLHPIAMSGMFCLVFSQLLRVETSSIPGYPEAWRGYAAFLLGGMFAWEFIRNSAIMGCNALLANEAYIRQCPLPYGIYPLRTVMGTGIHFFLALITVTALICFLHGSTRPLQFIWAVLPVVLMMWVFCWSLATLTAFANVYFPDTQHLMDVGSQLFFFLTPILYAAPLNELHKQITVFNPVFVFLELLRQPLVFGQLPPIELYAQGAALTLVAVGLASGTIAWLQKKVIFQL
jgi:lipopolysaccharide transport system permease protein